MRKLVSLLAALLVALALPALAGDARPVGDPAVEARVRHITEELRCLTCMGQSIADSHSGFSEDMRREIRQLIAQGKSDGQIIEFMVQRYGDFVLYRPPLKATTWLLWGGPFVLLAAGLAALLVRLRRRGREAAAALSEQEHAAAVQLLAGRGGKPS